MGWMKHAVSVCENENVYPFSLFLQTFVFKCLFNQLFVSMNVCLYVPYTHKHTVFLNAALSQGIEKVKVSIEH